MKTQIYHYTATLGRLVPLAIASLIVVLLAGTFMFDCSSLGQVAGAADPPACW